MITEPLAGATKLYQTSRTGVPLSGAIAQLMTGPSGVALVKLPVIGGAFSVMEVELQILLLAGA